MLPHKYATDPTRRHSVLGIELARIPALNRPEGIPVVAIDEPSQITVLWWNSQARQWNTFSRAHRGRRFPYRGMPEVTAWEWSNRAALCASSSEAYLVYKQVIGTDVTPRLYLERLTWNDPLLVQPPLPIRVPIESFSYDRPGHYLWATYVTSQTKLVIIAQLIRTVTSNAPFNVDYDPREYPRDIDRRDWASRLTWRDIAEERGEGRPTRPRPVSTAIEQADLVMLTADISQPALTWQLTRIDEGGYDFDARLSGTTVACIYRRAPYALSVADSVRTDPRITTQQRVPIPSNASPYAPLYVRAVDVGTRAVSDPTGNDAFEGGAHPQLQQVNPLIITCDRVTVGALDILPAVTTTSPADWGGGTLTFPVRAQADISTMQKMVMVWNGNGWAVGSLFTWSGSFPAHLSEGINNPGSADHRTAVDTGYARWSPLRPILPVFLTGTGAIQGMKGTTFDFLQHDKEFEGVLLTRYLIDLSGIGSLARRVGYELIDINHGLIDQSIQNATVPEVFQFAPFDVWTQTSVDNTLGGALVMDRDGAPLSFFAYVDSGDRGPRVIYDGAFPARDPAPRTRQKGLDAAAVTASGTSADQTIALSFSGWTASDLPSYPTRENASSIGDFGDGTGGVAGSLGSGLDVLIDTILGLMPNFDAAAGANPTILREGPINQLNEFLTVLRISLPQPLWDLLWMPIAEANTQIEGDALIFDSQLTIGKYFVEFFYTNAPRKPDYIQVTTLARHATEFRCRGANAQGQLDYRFKVTAETSDVDLLITPTYIIDSVKVSFYYSCVYTPAILMTEQRPWNPFAVGATNPSYPTPIETLKDPAAGGMRAAALCAKPLREATVQVDNVDVDISTSWVGFVMEAVIALFLTTALVWLGNLIIGLIAAANIAAQIAGYGYLIAASIFITIFILIFFVAPIFLEGYIEGKIRDNLSDDDFRTTLKKLPIMLYAREGLAESIARKTLQQASLPVEVDGKGRDRFREQFWQRIYVTNDACQVIIRP